ncbi:MAG: MFS transporter [Bacteroidia bacterium]
MNPERIVRKHDPFEALRIPEFSYFVSARFFLTLAIQMQSVIIGWQIYALTKDVLYLGYAGLAEALPAIGIALFSGHVADVIRRKRIILVSTFALALTALAFAWISSPRSGILEHYGVFPIFIIIVLVGIIRGFLGPAFPAWMAQIVPRSHYTNAATWNSTIWHIGFIAGNTIGGLLCLFGLGKAYIIVFSVMFLSMAFVALIRDKPLPLKEKKEGLLESLSAGLKFVFNNKIILGALSLDLFAVLFGGAVALLPAFSDKILHGGSMGFGILRAAPGAGAVVTAFLMAYMPQKKNAGRNLLLSIAGFGIATILFALSQNFYLSVFFLFLTGAFDNVSVVVRHSILQLLTPDTMRGRVSSVNSIFIGSSNEIGAFESGVAARLMGLVPSVIFGGAMTIGIVFLTARIAPSIRKLNLQAIE